MRSIHDILATLPQVGRLEWIGLSPGNREDVVEVAEAVIEPGTGLVGDHHASTGKGRRQVTLIQAEHLPVIGACLGRETVTAAEMRRNLVISGINLQALKRKRFRVGAAVFEGTGDCDPCSRMEENLGAGGLNAALGHGGITTIVLRGGTVRVGDDVEIVPE